MEAGVTSKGQEAGGGRQAFEARTQHITNNSCQLFPDWRRCQAFVTPNTHVFLPNVRETTGDIAASVPGAPLQI